MALIRKSKTTSGKFLTKAGGKGPGDEERVIEVPGEKGGKYSVTITQSDKDAVSRDSRYTQSFGNDAAAVYAAGGRFVTIEGKDVLLMGKGVGDTDFITSDNSHVGYVRAGGNKLRKVLVSPDKTKFNQADIASGEMFEGTKFLAPELVGSKLYHQSIRTGKAIAGEGLQTIVGGKTQILSGPGGKGRFEEDVNIQMQKNKGNR